MPGRGVWLYDGVSWQLEYGVIDERAESCRGFFVTTRGMRTFVSFAAYEKFWRFA